MAQPTTRVPATVPPSRAAVQPAKAAAATMATGSSTGFKFLVWFLVVLNVGAAGTWAWFKYMKNSEAQRTLVIGRQRLVKLQTDIDSLQAAVRSIALNKVNDVSDPWKLVAEVTTNENVRDAFDIGKVSPEQRFHKTNYSEKTLRLTFLNRRVWTFSEIVRLLTRIEAANPTVQIKDIDFGKRYPPTIGSDGWIPSVATVRVLQLSSGG